MNGRTWDASSYDRIGGPMTEMAARVLERLDLGGSETVLDAGCGTGRVTRMLAERVPRGRVIAVDADVDMVRVASTNLQDLIDSGRVALAQGDLTTLKLPDPVEAILSTATFHWIKDHSLLFENLFSLLAPGGQLAAQCGGAGNIAELRELSGELAADPRFSPWLGDWTPPWNYQGPEATTERLESAGFVEVRTWLEDRPVVPEDPVEYLSTIVLGAQVQQLPKDTADEFVGEVIRRAASPLTVGYVRLNITARRPI